MTAVAMPKPVPSQHRPNWHGTYSSKAGKLDGSRCLLMLFRLLAIEEGHNGIDELLRLLLLRHVAARRQHHELRPRQHRRQPRAVAHRDQGVRLPVDDEHLVCGDASQVSSRSVQVSTRP